MKNLFCVHCHKTMGNKQRPNLSRRRVSHKKGWWKRRLKLLKNKAQAENVQNTKNAQNIENATNIQLFVADGILSDIEVKEEKVDDYEKPIEAYEKESNGNTEYYKDKDNLNMDNEEKVEIYEEYILEEGNTNNENIEKCKEKDLIIDNKEDLIIDNKEDLIIDNKENLIGDNMENLIIDNKEDLIIDNNYLLNSVNNIPELSELPKNIPEGRYIVDLSFMWHEMHQIFDDHAQKPECQFKYWRLVNIYRRGLSTQLWFQCQICKQQASLWTEPRDSEKGINVAATAGSIEIGIGYSKMKKLCTAMNIKCMCEKTYIKNRNKLLHKKTELKDTRAISF